MSAPINLNNHIKIAVFYFLVVTVLGVFMRLFQVVDVPFDYKNILHAHSHVALLGWVYIALTSLIFKLFLSEKQIRKKYKLLFWSTQISIIGMLIAFPITGYALGSIFFSSLFLINSYFFVGLFLKNVSQKQKQTNSYKLIKTALWFLVLSSIGPWALGIIMNTLGNSSSWYRNAIYFFLHFQYNGWFVVALFGIFFNILEKINFTFSEKAFSWFYKLFISGSIFTFFLSVLWMKPHPVFYVLAGIGGVLQLAAFVILIKQLVINKYVLKENLHKTERTLLLLVALLFLVKLFFQCLGAIPVIATLVSTNMDFVIAYLHWIFLGIVTISLFVFLSIFKILKLTKANSLIYFLAFVLTEGLLFYKGIVVWQGFSLMGNYYLLLFLASSLFLIAIAGLLKSVK